MEEVLICIEGQGDVHLHGPVLGWNISMQYQKDAEPFDNISSYQEFQLTHPGSPSLLFFTENENSTEKWVAALRDAVSFQ